MSRETIRLVEAIERERDELKAQRDELLALLQRAVKELHNDLSWREEARTAIARVEEKA